MDQRVIFDEVILSVIEPLIWEGKPYANFRLVSKKCRDLGDRKGSDYVAGRLGYNYVPKCLIKRIGKVPQGVQQPFTFTYHGPTVYHQHGMVMSMANERYRHGRLIFSDVVRDEYGHEGTLLAITKNGQVFNSDISVVELRMENEILRKEVNQLYDMVMDLWAKVYQ